MTSLSRLERVSGSPMLWQLGSRGCLWSGEHGDVAYARKTNGAYEIFGTKSKNWNCFASSKDGYFTSVYGKVT